MSVNKVILVGTVGQDPQIKQFPNGGSITNVSIATSEQWIDKQTGQSNELTEWHRIVFNNRLAEVAGQYLRKGSKIYVEGSLRTRKWQDQNGQDRYTTEVRAASMQMLDNRNGVQDGGQPQAMQQQAPSQNYQQSQQNNQQHSYQQQQPVAQAAAPVTNMVAEDDIPF